jgi:ribosomal protein RSM22 (predicted rRNA methylase)
LSNSALLRERIASNAGMAGEQELMNLAMNEQIVVTIPANTRFFIVLQDAPSEQPPSKLMLAGAQGPEQSAVAGNSLFPTPQELRELIELKNELNRMYREVAATRTHSPSKCRRNGNSRDRSRIT